MHHTLNTQPVKVIGIDLAKSHCDFVCFGPNRKVCQYGSNVPYPKLFEFLVNLPKATVLMEACKGSHYVARRCADLGHDSRLVNTADVKCYRGYRHKNDIRDAEVIGALEYSPITTFVQAKTTDQQATQLIMRAYHGRQRIRIQIGNRIHAALEEFGAWAHKSKAFIKSGLLEHLENNREKFPQLAYDELIDLRDDWLDAWERERKSLRRINAMSTQNPVTKLLMTIPGIGPITSLALLVHTGAPQRFKNSRQFAASIGLVPQQYSTGGKDTLLGITKRGSKKLRSLLVEAAGTLLVKSKKQAEDPLGRWISKLNDSGKKYGVKACAIAAKLARIAWSMMMKNTQYGKAKSQATVE